MTEFKIEPLTSAAVEMLGQLYVSGPTWDGNVCSKSLDETTGHALATWARGGTAAPVPQLPAGAADTPTAADYFQQWIDRMNRATKLDDLASWNADKQLHKQIGWTSAHSYEDLKSKVLAAVESLRAPV
jgi:hypothetical protein